MKGKRTRQLCNLCVIRADRNTRLPIPSSADATNTEPTDALQEIKQTPLGETDVRRIPVHRPCGGSPCLGFFQVERVDGEERGFFVAARGRSVRGMSGVKKSVRVRHGGTGGGDLVGM
jgi:hypothetical protein